MSAPICASALFQEGGRGHVLGQRGQMLFSLPSTVQSSRFFWAGPKYNTGWTDCSEVWAGSPNGGVGQGSSVKRFMLLPILEYILGYMHTSFGSETWILESTKKIVLPRSIISMKVKQKIPSKSLTSQILYEDWPMMISIYSHFQLKHVFLANSVYFRNGLDNTKTYFKTTIVDTLSLLHLIGLVFTGKQHWLSNYIFVLFF